MEAKTLQELYIEELKDLYDAEKQLIKALPKLADIAASEELSGALEEHLEKTKGHVRRLEEIFARLGDSRKSKPCKGMNGLIEEVGEVAKAEMIEDVKDAALIASAQKIEHYEIAGYGTVRTYAKLLGDRQAAELLEQTLEEEKEADRILNDLAEHINLEASGIRELEGEGRREGGMDPTSKKPAA